ncbi:MAG: hypothetical protein A2731_03715 [Candidatus Buchananbacteria bacterium RIFCSPHIGHO2_01_FULL_39_8]|uniref:Helix-turn-helix domain-containing protein n=1 Tax=Candidatus Buchananbacteria bacterium RIFCSPHIGHO2_01_FULL_39_8 TaxID=1797533 RepID=A0A1G1XUJ6_9BACT|nr:MAG: hypothetical protein A2731_03715 [Candidatus Buchananbacteria bacterium RIFCSPHIGHO2_01_FULL_39_8]
MKDKRFFSTSEVAKLMGISRVAVFKKIKRGEIKAEKIGRNFVIDKNDLKDVFTYSFKKDLKKEIDAAVKKTVQEYGETLKLLGKE